MAISYNKLWKPLVDKKMSKADLRRAADLAPNTMTKLRRDEPVSMIVLEKICGAIDVDFGDIIQYISDEKWSVLGCCFATNVCVELTIITVPIYYCD